MNRQYLFLFLKNPKVENRLNLVLSLLNTENYLYLILNLTKTLQVFLENV